MPYSPVLIVHICTGTVGLLSGTAAICFRKGSPRHALAGKITADDMRAMNEAVDGQHRDPAEVVRAFREKSGL